MNAQPSLLSVSLVSCPFGAQRGKDGTGKPFFSFTHSLTRVCMLAGDGTEEEEEEKGEEGDCGQDSGGSRREVLYHRRSLRRAW